MVFLWYRASLRTAWNTGDPVSRSRRKGRGGGHKRRGCSGFEGVQSFLEEKMQRQECEETQCYFASVVRKPRTDRKRGCWRTKPHGQAPSDCFPPMRLHLLRSHSLPKQCHQLGTKHSNGGGHFTCKSHHERGGHAGVLACVGWEGSKERVLGSTRIPFSSSLVTSSALPFPHILSFCPM